MESQSRLNSRLGIVTGIPMSGRPVSVEWAITLACLAYPTGCNHTLAVVKGCPVDEARDELIRIAIAHEVKFLFFIDDDVRPQTDAILKLYPVLAQNPEVIAAAGIYSPKREPTEPMVYRKLALGPSYDWKFNDVFEVEGLATGLMLVRVDHFRKIPQPWFKTYKGEEFKGSRAFITDDLYFCDKALTAGFKLMAHGGVLGAHIDIEEKREYKLTDFELKAPAVAVANGVTS